MSRLICVKTAAEWRARAACALSATFDPTSIERDKADEHWLLPGAAAHCSLWTRGVPAYGDERLGLIGHYAARDEAAASTLLQHACTRLAALGCTLAVGPMDGGAWRRYRFVSERGTEPPFWLEPDHPAAWLSHFEQQDFAPLAEYSSALNTDLTREDERVRRAAARLADAGVSIRALCVLEFAAELRRIHAVAMVGFARNFLFTPQTEAEFIAQYLPLQNYVRPELVLLAECAGRTVGFLFALPDWQQARRGEPVNSVIIKNVAVLPGREFAGLGNVLVARCHAVAAELGYTRVIHALMHDANNSRNLSGRYAQTMRRYVLLARRLK